VVALAVCPVLAWCEGVMAMMDPIQLGPALITDGARVYLYDHLLTGDVECYAHDGGLLVLNDAGKGVSVTIDPIGMTDDEIERELIVGNTVLARADPIINRHERRKREAMN